MFPMSKVNETKILGMNETAIDKSAINEVTNPELQATSIQISNEESTNEVTQSTQEYIQFDQLKTVFHLRAFPFFLMLQ